MHGNDLRPFAGRAPHAARRTRHVSRRTRGRGGRAITVDRGQGVVPVAVTG